MTTDEKIVQISEKFGIPIYKIKQAFDLPLASCSDSTIEEAQAAYDNATEDSETEYVAFKKWVELFLNEVTKITTIDEAKTSFNNAPDDSVESQNAVLQKWIELCTTIEDVLEVFANTSENSEAKNVALKKWIELCTTAKEVSRVIFNTPDDSEVENIAFKKWVELFLNEVTKITTVEEINTAFDNTPYDREAESAVLKKMD